jgi:replication-associated recombination protein RarA
VGARFASTNEGRGLKGDARCRSQPLPCRALIAAQYDIARRERNLILGASEQSVLRSGPDAYPVKLVSARMLEGGQLTSAIHATDYTRMAVEDINGGSRRKCVSAIMETFDVGNQVNWRWRGDPFGLGHPQIERGRTNRQQRRARQQVKLTKPPKHIPNAPTKMMKETRRSAGMLMITMPRMVSGQDYFETMNGRSFYALKRGFERELKRARLSTCCGSKRDDHQTAAQT